MRVSLKLNIILWIALCAGLIAQIGKGYVDISLTQFFNSLVTNNFPEIRHVLLELRIPRALLAALVGAALGVSGAALQTGLQNPLADAGVLGIGSWASLGGVLVLYMGWSNFSIFAIPIGALTGGLFSTLILWWIHQHHTTASLLIAGLALGAFAVAGMSVIMSLSINPFALSELTHWILGSFKQVQLQDLYISGPLLILGIFLLLRDRRFQDALILGEDTAATLGCDLRVMRARMIWGSALCVGGSVASVGAIGFVGLLIPHLLRSLKIVYPSQLIQLSAIGGAVFLVWADYLVRWLPTNPELHIGAITALLGIPVFLRAMLK
ncbi:MAG: iron ABC transporter permease [Pseudomonadota bacterium]